MPASSKLEIGGRSLSFETGRLAKQANGSVLIEYEDTVVLVTATMDDPPEGMDFFPLLVNYEERLYSVGKIPGGFIKREGKPSDAATLAARMIDRPLRPLFPDGFKMDVQIICYVLSVNPSNDPQITALNGASAALSISDIPFEGPIGAVIVGRVDGEYVVNPNTEQSARSDLHLTVAGTEDTVLMVEAEAEEVSEEVVLEGIDFARGEISRLVNAQNELVEKAGQNKVPFEDNRPDESLQEDVRSLILERLQEALQIEEKLERNEAVENLKAETVELFTESLEPGEEGKKRDLEKNIKNAFEEILKKEVRRMIIEDKRRPDGRQPDEIRPIWCEIQSLPRAHGSGIFTRGQTQVLSVATLGAVSDEQILDGLGEAESKRFMHHYNFPPFSVGETKPLRAPGRREIGHGALGEKALRPVIPDQDEFPYTIRLVSEVLESNGSSSMASICGSSLALMDAGVPIKSPVTGIGIGLMMEGDQVEILSDIQGYEDFYGDMDFKVAGTENGITALHMDNKVGGIPQEILGKALDRARKGRLHILSEIQKVISEPRDELSEHAPRIVTLHIDPDKIRDVIGPGGKTINKIIEKTDVKIDIEDDGTIFIASSDQSGAEEAIAMIEKLTEDVEVGKLYSGTVKRTTNFGAFVEVLPGKEGLVHISKIADRHINKVEDVLNVGDEVMVKVTEIDNKGRINLSRKAAIKETKKNNGGKNRKRSGKN